jgi:predicted O-methyltransferase YrrM
MRGSRTGRAFRRWRARWLTFTGRREEAVVRLARLAEGLLRTDEIRLLYRSVRGAPEAGDVAEIGSWKGRSTVVMGLALLDAGAEDCRLYAIDPHEGILGEGSSLPDFRRNIRSLGVRRRVEELIVPSVEAAKILAARAVRLRLLFIDGAHDEESVRQDIRGFLPLVRPGGLIALHDCEENGEFPGVFRAYRSELEPRVEVVDRARSLLVTRLRSGSAKGLEENRS